MRPLVLCYHAVSDGWPDDLAVRPAELERQLRLLLRRGLRGATAAEVVAGWGRLLHVTFDDAYRSVGEQAVPVLERLRVPATVFACSGCARDGAPFDVPELADRLAVNPGEMATMSWDELGELAARGVEVGSHTISHPHLPRLSDADLRRELAGSRREIEERLGRRCRWLAYPYGDDDPRVHRAAAAAGYEAAFTLAGKRWADAGNRFALPRVDVYRKDSLLRAALKTSAPGRARAVARRVAARTTSA